MKLPHKLNPVHVASKDNTRYILNGVSIQGDLVIATDGRSLVAVKGNREDADDPRDALIPKRAAVAAWPQSKKLSKGQVLPMLTIRPVDDKKRKTVTVLNRDFDETAFTDIDGNYPVIEKVIPDPSKYTLRVGLNVKLLLQIAKCFGEDEVAIHFNADGWREGMQDEPMLITSKTWEAFGILMPCRNPDNKIKDNTALGAIKRRVDQKAEAERAAAEAARAEAEAKAEAEREKTAEWLAANQPPTTSTNDTDQTSPVQ